MLVEKVLRDSMVDIPDDCSGMYDNLTKSIGEFCEQADMDVLLILGDTLKSAKKAAIIEYGTVGAIVGVSAVAGVYFAIKGLKKVIRKNGGRRHGKAV